MTNIFLSFRVCFLFLLAYYCDSCPTDCLYFVCSLRLRLISFPCYNFDDIFQSITCSHTHITLFYIVQIRDSVRSVSDGEGTFSVQKHTVYNLQKKIRVFKTPIGLLFSYLQLPQYAISPSPSRPHSTWCALL